MEREICEESEGGGESSVLGDTCIHVRGEEREKGKGRGKGK